MPNRTVQRACDVSLVTDLAWLIKCAVMLVCKCFRLSNSLRKAQNTSSFIKILLLLAVAKRKQAESKEHNSHFLSPVEMKVILILSGLKRFQQRSNMSSYAPLNHLNFTLVLTFGAFKSHNQLRGNQRVIFNIFFIPVSLSLRNRSILRCSNLCAFRFKKR